MELRFQAGGPESWSADAVIVFLSEDEKLEKAYPELLDAAPWMSIAPGMRDFHGKKGEMGLLYGPPAHPLSRAVVVGLGKLDALTYAETLEELRKGAGAAAHIQQRPLAIEAQVGEQALVGPLHHPTAAESVLFAYPAAPTEQGQKCCGGHRKNRS